VSKKKGKNVPPPVPPGWRVMSLGDFLSEYAGGAGASSGSPATAGGTKKDADRATRTRLFRSHSTDHRDTQKRLHIGYRGLCKELRLDPGGIQATGTLLPFIVGVFNIGRAVAYRSAGRAFAGEDDPGEFPEQPVELEVTPGKDVTWRPQEPDESWTRAD